MGIASPVTAGFVNDLYCRPGSWPFPLRLFKASKPRVNDRDQSLRLGRRGECFRWRHSNFGNPSLTLISVPSAEHTFWLGHDVYVHEEMYIIMAHNLIKSTCRNTRQS